MYGGRLSEVIDATGAPAPTPCGRSAREDAAAQVWEAVCRHDPPLQGKEGVDALSDIAEDVFKYAVIERCDIVDKAECFEEWMSLPAGTVGAFSAMDQLKGGRRRQYRDIRNVLGDEEVAREGASRTSAHMGMDPKQYRLLVKRMLGIGMVK